MKTFKERIDVDKAWLDQTWEQLLDLPNEEANEFIRSLLVKLLQPQLDALIEQEVGQFACANNPDLPAPFFSKARTQAVLWRLKRLKVKLSQ